MKRLGASLRETAAVLVSGLRSPGIYILLFSALVLWAVAYQHKTPYTIDVGGQQDDAYVTDFHAKEESAELDYRWSKGVSRVSFAGIGNQPVNLSVRTIGFRPSGASPLVKIEARGHTFELQTKPVPYLQTFFLDRGPAQDGDLDIIISSPTFSPEGDPRELGVIVDSVTIEPAAYGLRPFIIPSISTLGAMTAGMFLCYICALATLRRNQHAVLAAATLAVIGAVLLVTARMDMGLLAPALPSLFAWGSLLSAAAWTGLDLAGHSMAPRLSFVAASLGSVGFVLAFLLRFGGLTYPQFLTSDLLLHVHYVQRVLNENWLFTGLLPDGTPVPYPPALYLLVAPFAVLLGNSDEMISLILKWTVSLCDSLTCVALALTGLRLGSVLTGGIAAILYGILPAGFELMSAGNYSNLFAQSALNLTLLGAMVYLGGGRAKRSTLLWIAFGFVLTMLGHYGMMLGALGIMGIFLVLSMWSRLRGNASQKAWQVLGVYASAFLASILLYYFRYTTEIVGQFTALFERLFGHKDPLPRQGGTAQTAETVLSRLGAKMARLIGTLPLLQGVVGATGPGLSVGAVGSLLGAWLATSGAFFILDQAVGDAIRWYYLAAAPVALLAGRYLARLAVRGGAARLLCVLSLLVVLAQLLQFWVGELIFVRYH